MRNEEVSLYDIWQKLVEYKKIFWALFFITFILGTTWIVLTPTKYHFSQIVEIGKYVNDNGNSVRALNSSDAIFKINKVLLPKAVNAYNLQTVSKIAAESINLIVDRHDFNDLGQNNSGFLVISTKGLLSDSTAYQFIFQKLIGDLAKETIYIDDILNSLKDAKAELEHDVEKKGSTIYTVLQRSKIQLRIGETYNTKAISDFTISNALGPSKLKLLFLIVFASMFFAFFGTLIIGFLKPLFYRHPSLDGTKT